MTFFAIISIVFMIFGYKNKLGACNFWCSMLTTFTAGIWFTLAGLYITETILVLDICE